MYVHGCFKGPQIFKITCALRVIDDDSPVHLPFCSISQHIKINNKIITHSQILHIKKNKGYPTANLIGTSKHGGDNPPFPSRTTFNSLHPLHLYPSNLIN